MLDAQFWWELQLFVYGVATGIALTVALFWTGDKVAAWRAARLAPDFYEIEFSDRRSSEVWSRSINQIGRP
jgi:hypothetical protein